MVARYIFQCLIYDFLKSIYIFSFFKSTGERVKACNTKQLVVNWRASVASETVLGVDNAKSGICYIYVCMDGTCAL